MNITLEQAKRLFKEAHDWYTGIQPYVAENSELREIAQTYLDNSRIIGLNLVCTEIFRVIAEDAMKGTVNELDQYKLAIERITAAMYLPPITGAQDFDALATAVEHRLSLGLPQCKIHGGRLICPICTTQKVAAGLPDYYLGDV